MATSEARFNEVSKIIQDQLGVAADQVKLEASFINDLGADSLDIVELVMKMEEEYGIEIPDEDAEGLSSVQDVANYLDTKKATLNA